MHRKRALGLIHKAVWKYLSGTAPDFHRTSPVFRTSKLPQTAGRSKSMRCFNMKLSIKIIGAIVGHVKADA